MRFAVGQAFECAVGGRQAVISEIRDGGRSGRLRFFDTGQQQWVLWAQFHNTGEWLAMGMRESELAETAHQRRLGEAQGRAEGAPRSGGGAGPADIVDDGDSQH